MNGQQVQFFTLSQLSKKIRQVLNDTFPLAVWIKADMLKLNFYPRSGHAFPDLVEKKDKEILAKIRANIWADDLIRIKNRFFNTTGKELGNGISILFKAEVRYHELYGLSLRIIDIDPTYTLGEMAVQKELTIKRLKNENLFDTNKKIPLANLPNRLAIISIDTSRGYKDLLKILWWEGVLFRTEITLFPAVLQGDKAVNAISYKIQEISRRKDEFDAILIIRGGGDEAGMDCYDNYHLAKAVALASLPVISGIGHSTNVSVVELIAHSNKITPTDVGYFLLSKYSQQYQKIQESSSRMITYTMMYFSEQEAFLQKAARSISNISIKRFSREYELLAIYRSKATELPLRKILKENQKLNEAEKLLLNKPEKTIKAEQREIQLLLKTFEKTLLQFFKNTHLFNENNKQTIRLLSPENILKRGYSLSLHQGKVLRNSEGLKRGDKIISKLSKGEIISKVEKIKKK